MLSIYTSSNLCPPMPLASAAPAAAAQIQVSHLSETYALDLCSDSHQFRAALAQQFHLPAKTIVGLSQGRFIFPLSFLCQAVSYAAPGPFHLLLLPFNDQEGESEAEEEEEKDVVISFTLSPDNLPIRVTKFELALLHFVRSKTVTSTGSPPSRSELESLFAKHMTGGEGRITKKSFDHLVRSLFPQTMHTPEAERKALSSSLSRIFFAFDRQATKEVLGRDLFTAFGVLLSQQGLEFAFQLADANGDGFVDKQEFFTFTRSFLTLVLALNGSVSKLSVKQVSNGIDATAARVLDVCFAQADLNHDELLTWGEFSNWYSQKQGHLYVPWVSLMLQPLPLQQQQAIVSSTVYEFYLALGYGSLRVTQRDVDLLESLLLETKLYECDLQDTVALFTSRADKDDGYLSKESYDLCLRRLLGIHTTCSKETLAMLQNVFFAFDRGLRNYHAVAVEELCTGFALLVRGTKSVKLQLCFSLFENEQEEGLTRETFTRFLRSVLIMLFALNEGAALMTSMQVFEMVESTCKQVTQAFTREPITFQDFANFYNSGNESIAFVELLDLGKFPFTSSTKHKLMTRAFSLEDKRVFSFDLSVGGTRLELLQSDLNRLQLIIQHNQGLSFGQMNANELVELCTQLAASAVWDRHTFDLVVGHQHSHNVFFDKMFTAFTNEEHLVESRQVICALFVLCGRGKKSDKLALGFALFHIHTQRDLALFIQSFLLMLFVITNRQITLDVKRLVWQVSVDLSERVGGKLEFEAFAEWYGNGGHKVASFLELLDQSKWPFTIQSSPSPQEEEKESVFVFTLSPTNTLLVTREDVGFIKQLVTTSGLMKKSVNQVLDALMSQTTGEYITLSEFVTVLKEILEVGSNALESLLTLFELCDRAQMGRCKLVDLFGGLVFLCGVGTKSIKLAASWSFVSTNEEQDSLTREELYALFRSLLIGLFAFNLEANSNAMEDTFVAVDEVATLLTATTFLRTKHKRRELISFEEFAEFYSQGGGYQLAPWLELLNLPKFIGSNGVASNSEEEENNVVFSFGLFTGGVEDGETEAEQVLVVTRKDIVDLNHLLKHSKLGSMDSEALAKYVADEVNEDGELTVEGFGHLVNEHILLEENSEEQETVTRALRLVFDAFDVDELGAVQPASLCVGLSLLVSGSKSSKLLVGWSLFSTAPIPTRGSSDDGEGDEDREEEEMGVMDEFRLVEFLCALLTSLSCFAGRCLSDEALRAIATYTAGRVFADLEKTEQYGEQITFAEFAQWYTSRGFETLSWIELLATSKWNLY
ncbi:hypothetical protein BASA81_000359 [Batrachochytrium salamandrivorans]|nr:hypothetical protein BASA81_000359 [Batrachochytrium salamandrivorans]